ncbi:glycoside hydrolase superfamily [Blakeslea trispora]|nr:glycoside hydrolase superfamily [Blakeslea trispora]
MYRFKSLLNICTAAFAFLFLECCLAISAKDKVVVGYWGYWESKLLPIEYIPWSQITHLNYGFATMEEDVVPKLSNPTQLMKVVGIAHQNNVKVLLSIGGWYGSRSMSKMASTLENRTQFVNQVVEWILQFGLDGIDIDWEYPGKSALECNTLDYANDTDNYLLLLKQLREALDDAFSTIKPPTADTTYYKHLYNNATDKDEGHKLLTMAVGTAPFSKNNAPITDVSSFSAVIDWVFVMMYDTYVGKSVIGPNAPLQTSKQEGSTQQSFAQAWEAWATAHMPPEKIIMGLPFYGYVSKPKEDVVHLKRLLVTAHASKPQGDAEDELSQSPCPNSRRSYSSMWKWRSLLSSGILLDYKTPGGQWIKNWDVESQTPWLYNPVTHHLIVYDDPDSIALKVDFAICKGARGVGVWDVAYDDYSQKKGQLLDVVNRELSANEQKDACLKINPIPPYKVVGPQFNVLSKEQLYSNAAKLAPTTLVLFTFFCAIFSLANQI